MSAGAELENVSNGLDRAKLEVDVMIIKRRVDRKRLESVATALEVVLSTVRSILGGAT